MMGNRKKPVNPSKANMRFKNKYRCFKYFQASLTLFALVIWGVIIWLKILYILFLVILIPQFGIWGAVLTKIIGHIYGGIFFVGSFLWYLKTEEKLYEGT